MATEDAGFDVRQWVENAVQKHLAERAALESRHDGNRLEPSHMKVAEYAKRIQVCKRTVENRITEGLPVLGVGRARRIPVEEADAWLRSRSRQTDLQVRARIDAARGMRRGRVPSE